MSFLSRTQWFKHKSELPDEEVRDISQILKDGRPARRLENLRFTVKTRGKSAACVFGRKQLREAILHCVVNEENR